MPEQGKPRRRKVAKALRHLRFAIERGREYPDAETDVAHELKLTGLEIKAMRAAYDAGE